MREKAKLLWLIGSAALVSGFIFVPNPMLYSKAEIVRRPAHIAGHPEIKVVRFWSSRLNPIASLFGGGVSYACGSNGCHRHTHGLFFMEVSKNGVSSTQSGFEMVTHLNRETNQFEFTLK